MKRIIGVVVAILVFSGLPAPAAEMISVAGSSSPATPGQFRLSVDRAVAAIVNAPAEPPSQIQAAAHDGETLARPHQVRARQSTAAATGSGGSHIGAIIGLVTTVGGIVGSVYMVKMMKKQMDQVTKP